MADENPVVETPEQELKSAEAAFAAATQEAPAPAAAEVEKPDALKAEPAPAEVVADPWEGVPAVVRTTLEGINGKLGAFDSLRNEIRAGTGRIAAIQSELAAAKAAAQTAVDAPTAAQIAEAAKSLEKWEAQKLDFPEWAAGMEERLATERAELLKHIPKVDVDAIATAIQEVEKRAEARVQESERRVHLDRVYEKYETWWTDTHAPDGSFTPEFAAWKQAQPLEIQALAASERPRDAIKMLDLYYDHRKAEATRLKNTQRLEAAIPAKGTQGQRQPTQNDRDAEEKAFASA